MLLSVVCFCMSCSLFTAFVANKLHHKDEYINIRDMNGFPKLGAQDPYNGGHPRGFKVITLDSTGTIFY